MQVVVDRQVADAIFARLSARDRRLSEDARAAVEWLTGFDGDEVPAAFSRRELQLFLWYQLPKKWLIRSAEQLAVAEALACFFAEVGVDAAPLAALCRSTQTAEMIRTHGKNLAPALERSGLEPPDTPLLVWSAFMSIEESLEYDLVAATLEDAIDTGELVPGAKGWRQRQTELVEQYLTNADESGTVPLARITAARRQNWLDLLGRGLDERALLEHALTGIDPSQTSATDATDAIEPLLWLLDELAQTVKLTQTGALPRALVRAAVGRYPDWWDTATVGHPYQEAELYPLGVLHDLVDQLKLARRHNLTLKLTPKGRTLRTDPQRLLGEAATAIAADVPAELDLALARLLVGHRHDIEWNVLGLLTPFNGIAVKNRTPTAVTPGGRTLAAAVLNARAHGAKASIGSPHSRPSARDPNKEIIHEAVERRRGVQVASAVGAAAGCHLCQILCASSSQCQQPCGLSTHQVPSCSLQGVEPAWQCGHVANSRAIGAWQWGQARTAGAATTGTAVAGPAGDALPVALGSEAARLCFPPAPPMVPNARPRRKPSAMAASSKRVFHTILPVRLFGSILLVSLRFGGVMVCSASATKIAPRKPVTTFRLPIPVP